MNAILYFLLLLAVTGCKHRRNPWDDPYTTGSSAHTENTLWQQSSLRGPLAEEFLPLQEEDLRAQLQDGAVPLSGDLPGELGSDLPGADHFQAPKGALSAIFCNLYFNTDEHVLHSSDQFEKLDAMAKYLRANPKLFVFVEGYCDQRGPQAYNLALGTRRANYVRTLLVQRGVDPDRLHTISYGKERLVDERNNSEAWRKNRRAEFKLYTKQ